MPLRLFDAIVLGDHSSAQNWELFEDSKITRVINCAARESYKYFEDKGIEYVLFYWKNEPGSILIDYQYKCIDDIIKTIDSCLNDGSSVLIHSIDCNSRAPLCLMIYLMIKCRWSCQKTLLFLQKCRPSINPYHSFLTEINNFSHKPIFEKYPPFDESTLQLFDNTFDNFFLSREFEPLPTKSVSFKHVSFQIANEPKKYRSRASSCSPEVSNIKLSRLAIDPLNICGSKDSPPTIVSTKSSKGRIQRGFSYSSPEEPSLSGILPIFPKLNTSPERRPEAQETKIK